MHRSNGGNRSSREKSSSNNKPRDFGKREKRPSDGGNKFSRGKSSSDESRSFSKRETRSSDGENKFSRGKSSSDESRSFSKRETRSSGGENKFSRGKSSSDESRSFGKRETRSSGGENKFSRGKSSSDESRSFSKRETRSSGGENKFSRGKSSSDESRSFGKRETRSSDGENKFSRGKSSSDESRSFGKRETRSSGGENKFSRGKSSSDESRSFGKRETRSSDGENKFSRGKSLSSEKRDFGKYEKRPFKTKPFIKRRKAQEGDETAKEGIRLNKYLAHAGLASRREADELIKTGVVTVNGKVVQEMGHRVQSTDLVVFDGKPIKAERKVYVLLNKPKGFITTSKDEKARKTVMDLVAQASPYRIYPVGRLDRLTTGVLLFTNDGDMAKKLTHPKHKVKKIYHVTLDKTISGSDLDTIRQGVNLEEGTVIVDKISHIEGESKNEVGLELHIGWNRVVRRLFAELGYEVIRLDRVYFGGLTKKGLKRGHWKILTEKEVSLLQML